MQLLRLFLLAKPKKELKTEACEDINEFGFSSILEKEIKGLFSEELQFSEFCDDLGDLF